MTTTECPSHFSYTRAKRDGACERAGYYYSIFGGTGIVPTVPAWDLVFGTLMHKALAEIARRGSTDPMRWRAEVEVAARSVCQTEQARAWAALAEGLIRGFQLTIWPRLMSEYTVFQAEQDGAWEVEPGQFFRFRQDLLLRHRLTQKLTYVEYKTTSLSSPEWIASLARSVQVYSSVYAMSQSYGCEIDHIIVQGLYKGYKDRRLGIQRSIFNTGWVTREPIHPDYSYTYPRGRGWEPFSTFDEFPSLEQWVANMPPEILAQQYPQTAPMFPRDDVARAFFAQQRLRNAETAHAWRALQKAATAGDVERLLDRHFRQNFERCQPAVGPVCEYLQICWEPAVRQDPLGSRLYVRRQERDLSDG